MTREQAADIIFLRAPHSPSKAQAENWVNVFVDLGLLKLDEPKSAYIVHKINLAFNGWPVGGHLSTYSIMEIVERAGLKIVEK